MDDCQRLLTTVRGCRLCAANLPLGPRPLLQLASGAGILIAGQAPGRKAHESGVPFDDASGERLRQWLGVDRTCFYDAERIAILPMGLCYPGSGKSGDLPPRPECAPVWRSALLAQLPQLHLTLVLGQYALGWHLPRYRTLTAAVADWQATLPAGVLALPHPSPRNQRWLAQHPWFAAEPLPVLQARVARLCSVP
ncbi:uracil-DNA glycosylase family protein [Vogesella oryzae]|uniref:uracil-DNA glycosylase family protein n=1 Tax=Vogesella oryzae TaxID=1735285 RepID=UPI001583E274|nr:uracil-DNA glycosylase family protein [Vogesella oryzae]